MKKSIDGVDHTMTTQAPDRLRTEYAANPLGMDGAPRFSWDLAAEQAAYRVTAASTEALLAADTPDLWDSGRVASGEHVLVPYRGRPLASGQRVHWRVTTWDAAGAAGTSAAAWFEMGLLDKADWQGAYICVSCDGGGGRGYHSRIFKRDEAFELWAAIDLGQTESFDRIVLQPTWCPEIGLSDGRGYGFPRRFRCELADTADFAGAVVIHESPEAVDAARWKLDAAAGRREKFLPDELPRPESVAIQLPALVTGRFFRLVVTEPFRSTAGDAIFSLDEIELVSGDRNVALGKRAFAANSHYRQAGIEIGTYDWHVDCLTDGLVHIRDVRRDLGGGNIARKEFVLAKPVVRARAYVASKGWHELHLNGTRVGDAVLDSAWTSFDKRLLYSTWDVTSLLRQGANAVGLMLGNGWTLEPAAILQLNIEHPDGSRTAVVTDGSWRRVPGPVRANHVFHGELYDATARDPAVFLPGFDDGRFPPAPVVAGYAPELSAQMQPPIRVVRALRPRSMTEPRSGVFVFDLGENISGWARLRVRGEAGREITLRYAETIFDDGAVWTDAEQTAARRAGDLVVADGMLNTANLRCARVTDRFICAGAGAVEEWQPRFTYHGFRFVELTGFPGRPDLDTITGCVVHTDVPAIAEFSCSHDTLNWAQDAARRTLLCNLHGVPTDCNQRDERQGWMGDAHVASTAMLCNFDAATTYRKWLRDMRDDQRADGAVGDTTPYSLGRMGGDVAWGAAVVLIAWEAHLQSGDRELLREHWDAMRRYLEFLDRRYPQRYVDNSTYGGDWLGEEATPHTLAHTGFFLLAVRTAAQAARALGLDGERSRWEGVAAEIGRVFHERFYDAAAGEYGTVQAKPSGPGWSPSSVVALDANDSAKAASAGGSQFANAFALHLGVVPAPLRAAVFGRLTANLAARGGRLGTGVLGTKILFETLSAQGRADLALAAAVSEDVPGFGYMRRHGATTLWELWSLKTGNAMNSHSHPWLADVSAWIYRWLAGIQPDAERPGYRHIHFRPQFPDALAHASGRMHTMSGLVASSWKRDGQTVRLELAVPAGSTATLWCPAGWREETRGAPADGIRLSSGKHELRLTETEREIES